jgi:hypothetical protein
MPNQKSVTFLTPDDLDPILEKLGELDAELDALEVQLGELDARVTALEVGAVELETRVAALEAQGLHPTHPIARPPARPITEPPPGETVPVDKAIWEAHMVEWGVVHGDALSTLPQNELLGHIYYDASRVHAQIAAYTGNDEPWHTYAKQATVWFRDQYVIPNNGAVPGYENFTTGLRMDYERTGDVASKDAAILLSNEAMYAADWTDPNYVAGMEKSREVAYALISYINAEALGEPKRDIRARYVTLSYDYITQWQDRARWETWQISPFMMGITAYALISDWEETADARCLPALRQLADWLWPLAFHAPTNAMLYQLNPDCLTEGGLSTTGAPDLNQIVAPWYAWLWNQTGETLYRDRFDALLLGHADAYLAGGKQWDQGYWLAFDGMAWREGAPR